MQLRGLDSEFDLVVVDGPTGPDWYEGNTPRWAALDPIQNYLADDFVVIFDDAHRPGTQRVIRGMLTLRPNAGTSWINAEKSQCVVFSPSKAFVAHY